MDEDSIQQLYAWIDEIALSRPKRNITRDFSDGVLAAEIIAHFLPGMVELHNYTPANNSQQKRTNWETLNRKVFKKLDFNVPANIVNGIIMCKPGVIEIVLHNLRVKILNYKKDQESEIDINELNAETDSWSNGHQNPYYQNMPGAMQGSGPQYPTQHPVHLPQHPPPHHTQNYPTSQMYNSNNPEGPHTRHPHQLAHPNFSNRQTDQQSNGALTTIPFEGEQVKKKKSPKKKKTPGSTQSPAKLNSTERSRSMPSSLAHLDHESRIYIQEREQALLQSQETIQILQSKISRLEHLLQLKDLRIEDLGMKLKAAIGNRPTR